MRAAVFHAGSNLPGQLAHHRRCRRSRSPRPGEVLLKVIACGVCRTDLHIVEGDLAPIRPRIIPGHQIVGEVVEGATPDLPLGTRVGVSWIGGVDGDCWYCAHAMENLCEHPVFTGYTVDGGYAEYAAVRADFAYPGARRPRRHPRRSAALRRHHRLPQPARGRRPARRTRRPVRLRELRHAHPAGPALLGLRSLRRHAQRSPPARPPAMPAPRGWAMKMPGRRSRSTAPSPSRPWEASSSARLPLCAKAEWWPSTPSTSTRCPPSTTTRSSGANARSAAWPT